MAAYIRQQPPRWFALLSILLVLWGLMGVIAFYRDVTMSESALAAMNAYDRNLLQSRPGWFAWIYGIATWSSLIGALLLAARRKMARALFAVALAAIVIQFGWVFLTTDLIAHKGAGATVPFPLLIVGIAIFQLWFSARARRRGWLQ